MRENLHKYRKMPIDEMINKTTNEMLPRTLLTGMSTIIMLVVMLFMGVSQTWIDFVVIVVFCGFIGYDFHKAMYDEPTLVNAVYNASELFLDIINVFVRVLSILGNRD